MQAITRLPAFTDKSSTHTHPFNGPLSGTTRVSRYQKGKTNLDFTEAKDSEWQWHQLGHMQVCIWLQTDNHASTPPLRLNHLHIKQITKVRELHLDALHNEHAKDCQ